MTQFLKTNQVFNSDITWLDMNQGLVYFNKKELGAGVGNNGKVFEGCINYNTAKAEKCAVKIIEKPQNAFSVEKANLELILTKKLKHKNIVHVHACAESQNNFYIFMDLCDGGSLQKIMDIPGKENEALENKKMKEEQAIKLMAQIIDALYYMKRAVIGTVQGVFHRDIKPDNIMFKNGVPLLIDFGMGKQYAPTNQSTCFRGSPIYMSPENFNQSVYSLEKNDVWSVGVILYQLVEGFFPWRVELADYEGLKNAQRSLINYLPFIVASPKLESLLRHMLQYDEKKRATWDDVTQHEVFQKFFGDKREQELLIQNLLFEYNAFKGLENLVNITSFDKIGLDLILMEIGKNQLILNENCNIAEIKELFAKRLTKKRKNLTFKSESFLREKLRRKLKNLITQLAIDSTPINLVYFQSFLASILKLFLKKHLNVPSDAIESNQGLLQFLNQI